MGCSTVPESLEERAYAHSSRVCPIVALFPAAAKARGFIVPQTSLGGGERSKE